MQAAYTESKTFDQVDFSKAPLPTGDYEDCHFTNCNLANINLSNCNFIDCTFSGCNLSMAKLVKTGLKGVAFSDCKLVGLRFDDCSTFNFDVRFQQCNLDLASFYKCNGKKTIFEKCTFRETDFTEADLTGADFDNCDLSGAVFENTNLEKADLRRAHHYTIDPNSNRIKKAKFSLTGLPGLLQQWNIDIS